MTAPSTADQLPPASYWHATFSPPTPEDALPLETEVAVVGGGMLGCWTAYWLARRGVDVTLLERDVMSWGATGRNGGFLVGGGALSYERAIAEFGRDTARAVWTIAAKGRALAGDVIADEGIDCDFRVPGIVSLALSEDELHAMRRNIALLQEDGFANAMVGLTALQELIRTPLGSEIAGGTIAPEGALVHSGRYLAGVAGAAQCHGARICGAGVTSLASHDGGVTLTTSAGELRAHRVVVAVNAWTDELVPSLASRIVPVRGQILAYEPTQPVFTTGVGTDVTPTGEYWQQTPDGSIVIGGCRAEAPNGDVGVRDMQPTPNLIGRIQGILPRLFPALNGLRVARAWAGLMAFTSDYLPVVDEAPDLPNVWVAGGFCGHGMPFGPRLGQLLAEAARTGETPSALHPFRIDRETLTLLRPANALQETDVVPNPA